MRRRRPSTRRAGFTLVEALLALAISSLVGTLLYRLSAFSRKGLARSEGTGQSILEGSVAIRRMQRELSAARAIERLENNTIQYQDENRDLWAFSVSPAGLSIARPKGLDSRILAGNVLSLKAHRPDNKLLRFTLVLEGTPKPLILNSSVFLRAITEDEL